MLPVLPPGDVAADRSDSMESSTSWVASTGSAVSALPEPAPASALPPLDARTAVALAGVASCSRAPMLAANAPVREALPQVSGSDTSRSTRASAAKLESPRATAPTALAPPTPSCASVAASRSETGPHVLARSTGDEIWRGASASCGNASTPANGLVGTRARAAAAAERAATSIAAPSSGWTPSRKGRKVTGAGSCATDVTMPSQSRVTAYTLTLAGASSDIDDSSTGASRALAFSAPTPVLTFWAGSSGTPGHTSGEAPDSSACTRAPADARDATLRLALRASESARDSTDWANDDGGTARKCTDTL